MAPRLQCFVFTVNNPLDDWAVALWESGECKYLVGGHEVAPTTGTPHIQGYCELARPLTRKQILELLPKAYIARRHGTQEQAIGYCKKDGDITELGQPSVPGARGDLESLCAMVRAGKRPREIAQLAPAGFAKFSKHINSLRCALLEPRNTPPKVTVLYGPTGSGKSRQARAITDTAYVWGPEQGRWFDGYFGESDVIFEEFRGQLPFGMLLRLLDRYDCKVELKGGMMEFCATNIVLTSPVHPKEWYTCLDADDKYDQLARRITEIICTKGNVCPTSS